MKPQKYSALIEVSLNSGTATQFSFPEQPYLRGKKIVGIMASQALFGVDTGKLNICFAQNYTPSTTPCFLTFQESTGLNFIQNLPLVELNPVSYADVKIGASNVYNLNNRGGLFEIKPRVIVWTKCFLFFPVPLGVDTYCAQFQIFYED